MDFFEKQAQAKRKSLVLITYFLLAVVATVAVINALAFFAFRYFSQTQYIHISPEYWLSGPFWWVTLIITGVIFTGSMWRYLQLRKGGSQVAVMMGAMPLNMDSRDHQHKRLINITEEISIASGMPMPAIFIMEQEQGINAFVAGHQLHDMTLTLSQGALDNLSRDELQGVIAHEFSHIQNADTRLNMHIIALLAGILLIGSIGSFLCRSASVSRFGMGIRSRSSKGSAGLFAVGTVLFVAGYTGLFFGRLIQAAVSRQREWLADATAVQFTRNPGGIAGALAKINDNVYRSWLGSTANAQEINHMCFGESLSLSRWLASHPPLADRISAIDPMFLTRQRAARNVEKLKTHQTSVAQHQPSPVTTGFAANNESSANPVAGATAKDIVGHVPVENFALSHELVNHFNQLFGDNLRDPVYAEGILYALLLRKSQTADNKSIEPTLSNGSNIQNYQEFSAIRNNLNALQTGTELSLLEIIAGVLKLRPQPVKSHISRQIEVIVSEDQRITFEEFIIQTFINCHLQDRVIARTINSAAKAAPYLETVLSMFARLGSAGRDSEAAKHLFHEINRRHYPLTSLTFRPKTSGQLLNKAVSRLAFLNPHLKPVLIDACLDCIGADGQVLEKEFQLLRITVEMMDCPMPPIPVNLTK